MCNAWSDPSLVYTAAGLAAGFGLLEVNTDGAFVAISVVEELDFGPGDEINVYGSVVAHPSQEVLGGGWIDYWQKVDGYLGYVFDVGIDSMGRAFATFETVDYTGSTSVHVRGIGNDGNANFWAGDAQYAGSVLAVGANGDAVLVWESGEGSGGPVEGARYTPSSGWQPAQSLSAQPGGHARPRVAMGPGGDAMVIWNDAGEIWSRRLAVDGVWQAAESVGVGNVGEASLAVDADGAAMVVWEGLSRRSTRSEGWGPVMPTAARGQLAADGSGRVTAIWSEDGEIFTSRFTPEGDWGPVESIGSGGPKVHLAVAPGGDAVAVWTGVDGIGWNRFIPSVGWASPGFIQGADTVGVNLLRVGLGSTGAASAFWSRGAEVYSSQYPTDGFEVQP
jgi:hypothetical protein